MRRRDQYGILAVLLVTVAVIAYRAVYLEPRIWGALCVSAHPPLACAPRAALVWLQRYYLMGAASLALGVWGLAWRGGFGVQLAAVLIGITAVENYNATWGAVGAALGAWAWLRRQDWAHRPARQVLSAPGP